MMSNEHDLIMCDIMGFNDTDNPVIDLRYPLDEPIEINERIFADNCYMVMFAGMGTIPYLTSAINVMEKLHFMPSVLWGWNRTIQGKPYALINTHGLQTTEYILVGTRGVGSTLAAYERITAEWGYTVFDGAVEGWQLDVIKPLVSYRIRPDSVYQTILNRTGATNPLAYGISKKLPYPWKNYEQVNR